MSQQQQPGMGQIRRGSEHPGIHCSGPLAPAARSVQPSSPRSSRQQAPELHHTSAMASLDLAVPPNSGLETRNSSMICENENGYTREYSGDLRTLPLMGHVGFDSLPNQLVNKSICQGFCFNILCVGETGIGKSTLIDTLFNTNFADYQSTHFEPAVKLKAQTYELQESNVRLKLTIINTMGFGDQINKENSYRPIIDYIDKQFEAYLQEELKIKRALYRYHDTRIHVCLYFLAPTGHSLKTLDLLTMKNLDSKVNIIPVISKADTVTKAELNKFKIKLMSELVSNGVQIYQFPTDDESISNLNASMNGHLPFAVVGSMDEIKVGNKMVKARQYPWGIVQGCDP